ncbi:hypothetical protein QO009_002900 [Brevibacillus aydinogluensis]|jgi:hypothetical protein|uniref:hypothetical protein n=1 Tax=Brevibacillus aydinogluensis TaxID=927786 RepID=UPI000E37B1B9|nr:hypothetical protein [Brevibacillus aydinogluensis]MDT3417005.1 hypothetical protein [Brevibacillus aydinogluensis]REK62639.1 MAG: hypothetical protein DF221_11930 [Brevibacillus sp.]
MDLEMVLGPGKKGVFYGVRNYDNITLEKQVHSAEKLVNSYNSIIIKKYVDTKKPLLLNDLLVTRKNLLALIQWVVVNKCDFIITYSDGCLYDDQIGKQKIKKFVVANQMPIILSTEKKLFHPLMISY